MQTIARNYLRVDSSMSSTMVLGRLLTWAVVLAVLSWIIIGLASLRFELGGDLGDVFYSQVILACILVIGIANAYLVEKKAFGHDLLSKSPVLWGSLANIGLLMLIWQIWVDFTGGPNEVLKVMYSLLGIGLCGTYAASISLLSIDRVYEPLRWVMYLLTVIVGAEVLETLWSQETLSGAVAGAEFARAGLYIGITMGIYAFGGAVTAGVMRKDTHGVIAYTIMGLAGFGLILTLLWDALQAGPLRFVFGASLLLSISTVALFLMSYYNDGLPAKVRAIFDHDDIEEAPRPQPPASPSAP